MKNKSRTLATLAGALLLVMLGSAVANASSREYSGSWSYFNVGSGQYRLKADLWIDTSSHASNATGEMNMVYGPALSIDWAATQARLYESNGALYCASTWEYNSSWYFEYGDTLSGITCTPHLAGVYWFAKTHGKIKDGGTWHEYISQQSPQTYS